MKTPSFWYVAAPRSTFLATMLAPLSFGFRFGAFVRRQVAQPYRASIPLICVGNAVAGGAGKTPTAIALARLLKDRGHRPVFVTRGYGGSGALTFVDRARHTAGDVGDEALLLAAHAPVWVGRDRVAAIRQAEREGDVIIMDDGMQNPHVAPSATLLVFDGERGVGNNKVIPAGPLREPLVDALARSSAVIILGHDRHNLAARTRVPVFVARLEPQLPSGFPREGRFIAFAGIAHPQKFYATARALGLELVDCYDFPDHHLYDDADIAALRLRAEEKGARLLTTEKDIVRFSGDFRSEPVTLPVHLKFEDANAGATLATLCWPSKG